MERVSKKRLAEAQSREANLKREEEQLQQRAKEIDTSKKRKQLSSEEQKFDRVCSRSRSELGANCSLEEAETPVGNCQVLLSACFWS